MRSYLTARNITNRGILETIEEQPEYFVAFNNGLTITANSIELNAAFTEITSLGNVQIVNGGQTTNTIYRAKYLEGLDLSKVSVPAKICVLDDENANELAPKIATFANQQSAVRKTDIASTNQTYRQLETLSRPLWFARGGLQVDPNGISNA